MEAEKVEHFRQILLKELRRHNQNVREDQATALESADDGVRDAVDMSLEDVNKEVAFRLGEHESQIVADIDQALLRIDEGSYGTCARCGEEISERRLEAMPSARYCAQCQSLIEQREGTDEHPTM